MARPYLVPMLLIAVASSACSSADGSTAAESARGASDGVPTQAVGCTRDVDADAYSAGMDKPGREGQFSFELVSSMPAPPALNDNTFVVQVRNAGGRPQTGQLSVALDMPQHGHPSPEPPAIRFDDRDQAFIVAPANLFMVGLWQVTFTFQPATLAGGEGGAPEPATEVADSAVFKFCIQ